MEDGFLIGSVTKTFIATPVLQEVDEGSVDLDTQVAEYLPELSETYPDIGKVTVRQLLATTPRLTRRAGCSVTTLRATPRAERAAGREFSPRACGCSP